MLGRVDLLPACAGSPRRLTPDLEAFEGGTRFAQQAQHVALNLPAPSASPAHVRQDEHAIAAVVLGPVEAVGDVAADDPGQVRGGAGGVTKFGLRQLGRCSASATPTSRPKIRSRNWGRRVVPQYSRGRRGDLFSMLIRAASIDGRVSAAGFCLFKQTKAIAPVALQRKAPDAPQLPHAV